MNVSAQQRIYVVLCATFITALLVADTTAGKFFLIGDLEVSVGVVPFPITFIVTDIVNEYYGRRGARFLTGLGMAMIIFAFLIIFTARLLPVAPGSPVAQASFDNVFGLSLRLFAASLAAYLAGQLTDIYAFNFYKKMTNTRHLWLRATGSTAISQVIDTSFVNFGALWGYKTVPQILEICVYSYLYKMAVAIALTPVCYLAHDVITRRFGIEPAPVEEA